MGILHLINKDSVDQCSSDEEAFKLLHSLRESVERTYIGCVDPRPFSAKKRSHCENATIAAMNGKHRLVLIELYEFLHADDIADREITDSESATLNLILLIVEEYVLCKKVTDTSAKDKMSLPVRVSIIKNEFKTDMCTPDIMKLLPKNADELDDEALRKVIEEAVC